MKKKGFTLIELLAVIVILAVIALIATPAVLNIIEDSRKSAAEASVRNITNAAKTHYMLKMMEGESVSSIDLSGSVLTYDGDKAKKGNLAYDANGNVIGKMYISGYCVEVNSDGTLASDKISEDECTIEEPKIVTHVNGKVVYYNPETNTKCDSSEAVSATGTKTGCMKWFAFNDDGSDTVNLLLDHNTTAAVPWITEEDYIESGGTKEEFERQIISKGPITALKQLKSDTSTWNKSINPRLIEANEIVTITEYPIWDNNFYYFHTNSQTQYKGAAGTNKYAWLFDNTRNCTQYGCNVADPSTYAYWTNTANSGDSNYAWFVFNDGSLYNFSLTNAVDLGVRPVITISKSIIS